MDRSFQWVICQSIQIFKCSCFLLVVALLKIHHTNIPADVCQESKMYKDVSCTIGCNSNKLENN